MQLRQYQSTDNQVGTCASPPLLKQSPSVSKCNVPTGSCEKPFGNTTRGNTKDPTKNHIDHPLHLVIPITYTFSTLLYDVFSVSIQFLVLTDLSRI